jgi:cytochrome c peroxidase
MRGAHHALSGAALLALACSSDPQASQRPPGLSQAEYEALLELSPAELPAAPPDVSNRFADDARAARLGQRLFFDPGFSGTLLDGDNDGTAAALGRVGDTGKVSCAGCHVPEAGFLDDRTLGKQISLGSGWGRRKAPSLLDVGQVPLFTWDGRRDALYNQPFGPIESPVEMNSSRLYTAQQIHARYRDEYEALFGELPPLDDGERFPPLTADQTGCHPTNVDTEVDCNGSEHGIPGDGHEFDSMSAEDQELVTEVVVNMGKALGAYERLLTCGPARFDRWLRGEPDALNESERRGAQLFVGKAGCVDCHSGPFLSDQKFHNVGLQPKTVAVVFIDNDDPGAAQGLAAALEDPLNVRGKFSDGDDGRLPEKVDDAMLGAFRTPMLRCVASRPSFMHTGHMARLSEVVDFFARGGDNFGFLGKSVLQPLELSAEEKADLVAFLGTLEGSGPAAELLVAPE